MQSPRNPRRNWPLLLPLVAVLLFGNCGGVRSMLNTMGRDREGRDRRSQLRDIVLRRQSERTAARQRLRGRALQDAYWQIEQTTNTRTDSLLHSGTEQRKFRNRRNKLERQLLRAPAPPGVR